MEPGEIREIFCVISPRIPLGSIRATDNIFNFNTENTHHVRFKITSHRY